MRICNVEGCNKKHRARGYCVIHYNQMYLNKKFDNIRNHNFIHSDICIFSGCGRKYYSKGYCVSHYNQLNRTGEVWPINDKDRLQKARSNANFKGGRYIDNNGYVIIRIYENNDYKGRYVLEHRNIMEQYLDRKLKHEEVVHHINEVRNDNRIENLMLFKNDGEHHTYHKLLRMNKNVV